MMAQTLLLAAMGLFGLAGLGAMLAAAPRASRIVSGVLGALASLVGLAAALLALANPVEATHPLVLFVAPPFGMLAVSLVPVGVAIKCRLATFRGRFLIRSISWPSWVLTPFSSSRMRSRLFVFPCRTSRAPALMSANPIFSTSAGRWPVR